MCYNSNSERCYGQDFANRRPVFRRFQIRVVTPLSVVDLPESYKDALAGVTGTFQVGFQPFYRAWKLSGRFPDQQHLTGGLPR